MTAQSPGTATGWSDYEFLYGSTYEPANDTLATSNLHFNNGEGDSARAA